MDGPGAGGGAEAGMTHWRPCMRPRVPRGPGRPARRSEPGLPHHVGICDEGLSQRPSLVNGGG